MGGATDKLHIEMAVWSKRWGTGCSGKRRRWVDVENELVTTETHERVINGREGDQVRWMMVGLAEEGEVSEVEAPLFKHKA
jgi:hypothetical protein